MNKQNTCPEIPYFGAHYPDAACIDGNLYDLDRCDESGLISTGDEPPCPFCRMEDYIEFAWDHFEDIDIDDDALRESKARAKCREYCLSLHQNYGYRTQEVEK